MRLSAHARRDNNLHVLGAAGSNARAGSKARRDHIQRDNQRMREGSQPGRALVLLAEMQGRELKPVVITYNATISACEKGQRPERALELLAEMQGQGLDPDVITYNATISACAKGFQPARALELPEEMQGRGLDPNVITYSAAISACAKGYLPERALELFAETARNQRMREGSAT